MKRQKHHIRGRRHRLPRSAYQGLVRVNITACILNRVPIFIDDAIIDQMVSFLRSATNRYHCSVPIYCFMPDHLHMVMRGETADADIWQAMVTFKQMSGYWLKSTYPNVKWQSSFYDHILRNDESLHNVIAYIANNPTRANLVARWEDYPFTGSMGSILRDFLGPD